MLPLKTLNRRRILKGMLGGSAVTVALPFLDCFLDVNGTAFANGMFGLPLFFVSHHNRSGVPMLVSEFVATFGLLAVIWGCARSKPETTPFAVAAYIVGAYWFTSSTSFANPAVTIARSLSDTFAGIRPIDIAPFIAMQLAGAHRVKTVRRRITMTPSDGLPVVVTAKKGRSERKAA